MKALPKVWLTAVVLAVALLSQAYAADFVISNFASSITVHTDSSFTVRETISVEFLRPRHGIYREVPFRYRDSLGRKIETPVEIIGVTDGAERKLRYRTSRQGDVINIRIGDPDKYVSGVQTYVIAYRVQNAILFFDDHDELYWNVTGDQWDAEIKAASCSISLADKRKTKNSLASCYTGRRGSNESACSYTTADNLINFTAKRPFSPNEGLTVAYGWDKGIVSPPSGLSKFLWKINLGQNWVFLIPFLSLIIMGGLWYRRGRDPKVRESVTVMYGPPKYGDLPLTPAEVGALVDETLDPRDITASIVGLAVKGFIKIEETKQEGIIFDSKDYFLAKLKGPDGSLSAFEKLLMEGLFTGPLPGVQISELKNKFYKNIDMLKAAVFSDLVAKGYFAVSPDRVKKMYIGITIGVGVGCALALHFLFGNSVGQERVAIASLLAGLPVFGFARLMPAKTRAGASAYMDIRGFEEFLNRAEKDRLVRMNDENLFSKFLPYALALNVAENWGKAFEGIYQQPPDWYSSPSGFRTFSPGSFTRSLNSTMSSLSTAMYSAPRSSGAGGGGSSGGGFGGGGGGSW
ncbi:MAG: DUF2207 domain-containing protein [Nitrospiraceae bacterium]|nr:DUF2207 domain-containing protein [Nitrospiraceae bacterium]